MKKNGPTMVKDINVCKLCKQAGLAIDQGDSYDCPSCTIGAAADSNIMDMPLYKKISIFDGRINAKKYEHEDKISLLSKLQQLLNEANSISFSKD